MYKNNKKNPKSFEDMIQEFLKDSKKKSYEINSEHTKADKKKKKKENAKRRKDSLKKLYAKRGNKNNE